jgi:hypothetical protein
MSRYKNQFTIDCDFYFDSFICNKDFFNKLHQSLISLAPVWSTELKLFIHTSDITSVPKYESGLLYKLFFEKNQHYVKKFKAIQKNPRWFGSAELRGKDNSIIVVVSTDEHKFSQAGKNWHFKNSVTIQIRKRNIENLQAADWAQKAFSYCCNEWNLLYANGNFSQEFEAKNMDFTGGGVRAIGVDYSRYLPGIYWLNYFGKRYVDFIGKEKLLTTPAYKVEKIGYGILVQLHEDGSKWDSKEYRKVENNILNYIGRQYFFNLNNPDKKTLAPNFNDLMKKK